MGLTSSNICIFFKEYIIYIYMHGLSLFVVLYRLPFSFFVSSNFLYLLGLLNNFYIVHHFYYKVIYYYIFLHSLLNKLFKIKFIS